VRENGTDGYGSAFGAIEATDATHSIDTPFRLARVAAFPPAGCAVDAIGLVKSEEKDGNRIKKAIEPTHESVQ
jgi:hypothetical protein